MLDLLLHGAGIRYDEYSIKPELIRDLYILNFYRGILNENREMRVDIRMHMGPRNILRRRDIMIRIKR